MGRLAKAGRILAVVAGAVAVAWGCVVAGLNEQPIPLILAGVLVAVAGLVGDGWEEIALKFGDSEARVRRVKAATDEVVKSVTEAVARTDTVSSDEAEAILEVARTAQRRALRNAWAAHTPRLQNDTGPRARPTITVSQLDPDGRCDVVVSQLPRYDWTVERTLRLHANGKVFDLVGEERTYRFPDDWGLAEVPAYAMIELFIESIYGGERAVEASLELLAGRPRRGATKAATTGQDA